MGEQIMFRKRSGVHYELDANERDRVVERACKTGLKKGELETQNMETNSVENL